MSADLQKNALPVAFTAAGAAGTPSGQLGAFVCSGGDRLSESTRTVCVCGFPFDFVLPHMRLVRSGRYFKSVLFAQEMLTLATAIAQQSSPTTSSDATP